MKLLESLLNLLTEEWKKLSMIYKLWSLFCFLLEFLFISLLQHEILSALKRVSDQHYIWFFLIILIFVIPGFTYVIAWLICAKNSNPSTDNGEVIHIQTPETQSNSEVMISSTNHSFIEKKIIHGQLYIIKKTKKIFCDVLALKKLAQQDINVREGDVSLRIATPSEVWIEDEYVAELIPYYEGITLHQLITSNEFLLSWDLLGEICNCLILAINQLHEINIIHRDIVPSNILINDDGNILLIDCSFCCQLNVKQVPIFNREFSAPELKLGNAVFSSDWYSIVTTIYFLANGFPPPWNDEERLHKGFQNINIGSFACSQKFFTDLTKKDISSRPKKLFPLSVNTAVPTEIILGVFRINNKYLVNYHHDHVMIDKNEISPFLITALKENRIDPDTQEFREILKSVIEFNQLNL